MPAQTKPPQHQERQPGLETEMKPRQRSEDNQPGSGKLKNKVALITGGEPEEAAPSYVFWLPTMLLI